MAVQELPVERAMYHTLMKIKLMPMDNALEACIFGAQKVPMTATESPEQLGTRAAAADTDTRIHVHDSDLLPLHSPIPTLLSLLTLLKEHTNSHVASSTNSNR